jgi:hypothetical protein
LQQVGFEKVQFLGFTDFWTSPLTRGVNFVATKPPMQPATQPAAFKS